MITLARWLGAATLGLALLAPTAHAKAPDFTLRDLSNQTVRLSDFQGKVTLINFWATWCGPCKDELPHLDRMYRELGEQGLVVLAISTDDARSGSQVKPYVKRSGFTFPVLRDPDSSALVAFNPTKTLPYSVLVDRQGNIASVHAGYEPGDEVALRERVVGLLEATPGSQESAAPGPAEPADAP